MDPLLDDIERRESSSSRSTSAFLSTPIDTTPTHHLPQQPLFDLPHLASPFKDRSSRLRSTVKPTHRDQQHHHPHPRSRHRDERDIMPEYEDEHTRDRARRSFDITSSWVEDIRQHRGRLEADQGEDDDDRDEMGFLRPPEAGPSRLNRRSSCMSIFASAQIYMAVLTNSQPARTVMISIPKGTAIHLPPLDHRAIQRARSIESPENFPKRHQQPPRLPTTLPNRTRN